MNKHLFISCLFIFQVFEGGYLFAQDKPASDSFFLSGKTGILGRLARAISVSGSYSVPVKTVNKYKAYHGKIIRTIVIDPVGFNYSLNDTTPLKNNFPIRVANGLHKNTSISVLYKNLFFKEGQRLYPLVIADNERYLREQPFLRDALIVVAPAAYAPDSVDVIVLTRDVFSIGGKFSGSLFDKVKTELREENFHGSGNRVALFGLYERDRKPVQGLGAEVVLRNIKGSFINWSNGFNSFAPTFNSGRLEEVAIYSIVEKPMVSRYTAITGASEVSYHATLNGYLRDSLYSADFRYKYLRTDLWAGFNFGYQRGKSRDSENRLRHFVAARGFYNNFLKIPGKYMQQYDSRYADISGVLFSYSLYRQNFYNTNFIYGFGRNEDVPEGINATAVAGFINKVGVRRAYYGLETDWSQFTKKEGLFSLSGRTGAFVDAHEMQDINILLRANHFTKLNRLSAKWFNRCFFGMSYAHQYKTFLNEPLYLKSEFGIPYYRDLYINGERRISASLESVFYNTNSIFGFRLAPFVFGDLSVLQPVDQPASKSEAYSAIGGGIRTRNENLVFGTVELRGYYFPKMPGDFKNWKVELSTRLLFKYNSSFIRRPDFVLAN